MTPPPVATTPFTLPPLPWSTDALEPYMSARTLAFHHGKHHAGYLDKVNQAITANPRYAGLTLAEVVVAAKKATDTPMFENAAQAWNHTFFWQCLTPGGGGEPQGALADHITADFGSFEVLRKELADAAAGRFGSGWAWLVQEDGKLRVITTPNAETPITGRARPLLTIDVWEHAYYLDYQNRRADYLAAVLDHLLHWNFALENLTG